MKKIPYTVRSARQRGSMLIEVLVAVLIFSVGILGIVGLQASSVKASSDAKYRSEAGLLANELIGQMWASDRTQATLQAAFNSPTSGASYQAWAWGGAGGGGNQTAPAAGTVLQILPGAQSNPPLVVVAPVAAVSALSLPSSLVTITIFWQAPNEAVQHSYVATAQIGG
jgi:type IV pilus assembly protein PilV